jgi:hypothetical protein
VFLVAALAAVLCLPGCQVQDVDTTYGKRHGREGGASVNGTVVLSRMFVEAGHRVASWRRLSPKLSQFQVIVWTPDSFELPSEEQRQFLENWLAQEAGRTLIYIGRDHDAAITFWTKILPQVPAQQWVEATRRLATAQAKFAADRAAMEDKCCDWFALQPTAWRRPVRQLQGAWSRGVDAARSEIEVAARFDIPRQSAVDDWMERQGYSDGEPRFERLLFSADLVLVRRITLPEWRDSQILLIPNGSFLLNLPLVNTEHRKLAGRLITACGAPGRVAFLESEAGGPPVLEREPDTNAPTGFEVFTVWPIGVVAVHLVVLGIAAGFALFPIFGRPWQPRESSPSDFGKHVEALGELLETTGDKAYAMSRIRDYQTHVRRDHGSGPRRE